MPTQRDADMPNQRVAEHSEATVRSHLENIHTRLHVSSRTAAVTRAFADRIA